LVRIENLQFTPDGQRLALLLDEVELSKSDHPLRRNDVTTTPVFQIVEFPAGTLVSQFPAGVTADLPLAFSADGKRVASQYSREKSGVRIVERDVNTGAVRREYESKLDEFASALGWSPDGTLLAVVGISGEALVWDTESGQLRHQVPLGQSTSSVQLRFSPDGKFLAVSLFPGFNAKLFVIDVATGAIVATVKQETSGSIHWAADSQSFDVLYDHRGILEAKDKAGRQVMYNMFPVVRTFNVAEIRKKG
jgi:WD40 repeat protein